MSSEEDPLDSPVGLEDDLFGSDDEVSAEKPRQLSDEELDSGDDEGRRDRAPKDDAEEEDEGRVARILESSVARHPLPKPSDGELNTLRLPAFLGIDPYPYDPETFQVPTVDHHSDSKSRNFSASAVAASTIRFRKAQVPGRLESNTVVYKWSDGSLTIAVGGEHYELQGKPLAPPKDKPYQPLQDSHTYLASPSILSQLLVVIGHMDNQYSVRPNKGVVDEALERLQMSLAAATRRGQKGDEKGPEIINNTVDPELQKRKAEMAEKERLKAQRRRDTAAEKASMPRGYGGRVGLNVDDLEGRSGRRAPTSATKRAKPKRKPGYDSDDSLPRGRRREDSYDKEDDFVASSDEEEEPEADDDEDELEDDRDDRRTAKRVKISKDEDGSDADADADFDDEEILATATTEPAGRGRKRHVIEDDDDE